MARFWNELSSNQKNVFLLESLARNKDPDTPRACRLCDKICVDNQSLISHFQSHFNQDGTSNPRLRMGSPEIGGSNFFSSSSQFAHVRNSGSNGRLGPFSWPNIPSQNPLLRNYTGLNLFQNPLQSRGPTLTLRTPSFPSPSVYPSLINQSSNFHSRFASQPRVGAFGSQFNPGTSGSALRPFRRFIPTARRNEVEDSVNGYTKPYIMQLEVPLEEMMVDYNDEGGDVVPDEMDLTLRLRQP